MADRTALGPWLARCYERRTTVVDAFFDLADTIITVRSLIPAGMDHSPLGRTPEPPTMTAPLSRDL